MKKISKILFLVFGFFTALVSPTSAELSNTTRETYQTVLIPTELLITAIILALVLIIIGIIIGVTQETHAAIWVSGLALLTSAFALGCSFTFGNIDKLIDADNALIVSPTIITNIGVTLFCLGLLVFSVIMMVFAVLHVWQLESKKVM